jgi:hypothetical protein
MHGKIQGRNQLMKARTFNYALKGPRKHSKIFKEIDRMLAQERVPMIRQKAIATAHYIQEELANNAPKPIYADIIRKLPVEKMENRNSGYDFTMSGNAEYTFSLRVSPRNYPLTKYKGYNPVWGLLVSDRGRGPIDADRKNPIPIPIDGGSGRKFKRYNHPEFGYSYQNRYKGRKVMFLTHVGGVVGSNWIGNTISNVRTQIFQIFAGR